MKPIDFENANITLGPPLGVPEEECQSIRALAETQQLGNRQVNTITTVWMPSAEDLEAFNAGRPLVMTIWSTQFPPVALYTHNGEGDINHPGAEK